MKGKLLLLFCLMFPFFLFSQVHIGISGGGGLDNMVSLRASIPVEIALSKSLSLQPAFVFTQQHIPALLFRLGTLQDYRRATVHYIAVPLAFKVRIPFESFIFYVMTGPQLAYATSLNVTYVEDGIFGSKKFDFERAQVSRWDASIVSGIGVEKVIRKNCKIRFELVHLLGLMDIDQCANSAIYTEGKVFNLGFMIPL